MSPPCSASPDAPPLPSTLRLWSAGSLTGSAWIGSCSSASCTLAPLLAAGAAGRRRPPQAARLLGTPCAVGVGHRPPARPMLASPKPIAAATSVRALARASARSTSSTRSRCLTAASAVRRLSASGP